MEKQFDIAISFAKEETWIARDLYKLLVESRYTTYYYLDHVDLTKGYLRKNLHPIYTNSQINVMLWSAAYSNKTNDPESIVYQEFQILRGRHLANDSPATLLIACIDDTQLPQDFEALLRHNIRDEGVVGLRNIARERIRSEWKDKGGTTHPKGTEFTRSARKPCHFRIVESFRNDRLGRWKSLGDIEVNVRNDESLDGIITYLIPGDVVPEFIRHTYSVRHDPTMLAIRKAVASEFFRAYGHTDLVGERFLIENDGVSRPHVYCDDYDTYVINNWKRCLPTE